MAIAEDVQAEVDECKGLRAGVVEEGHRAKSLVPRSSRKTELLLLPPPPPPAHRSVMDISAVEEEAART